MWWGPSDTIPYCAKEGKTTISFDISSHVDQDKHVDLGVLFLLYAHKKRESRLMK